MYLEIEDELPALLYKEYKKEWCEERRYELEEMELVAEDEDYSGECFACYGEFCDNELQDGEYAVHLMARVLENSPQAQALKEMLDIDDYAFEKRY